MHLPRLALAALLVLTSPLVADDLKLFQGVWEMNRTTSDGRAVRIVKTIEKQRETFELYVDGELTRQHHVDFELKSFGPCKVFAWTNGEITAGAQAGQKLPDGRFVYRIDEQRLVGVFGMLEGDRTGVNIEVFQRVSDEEQDEE